MACCTQCRVKPYEEMSAMFNGNEVKIRIPKHTKKPRFPTASEEEIARMCTCDSGVCCSPECCQQQPDEFNCCCGGTRNQMCFQLPSDLCDSRQPMNSELTYCKQGQLPSCNITPDNAPRGVQACKILDPDKDVFVLKIGKQKDEPDRNDNIEVELVTPRAPAEKKFPERCCKLIQCGPPMCMECQTKKKKKKKGKKRKGRGRSRSAGRR